MTRRGAPHGVRGLDPRTSRRIAEALLAGVLTKPQIATAHGVTYEQVRTIQRNLQLLGAK